MPRHPTDHRHRPLSLVGDEPLPEVRIDGVDTVPMSGEQYTAAVHALAALIDTWRAAQACLPESQTEDAEGPLAA